MLDCRSDKVSGLFFPSSAPCPLSLQELMLHLAPSRSVLHAALSSSIALLLLRVSHSVARCHLSAPNAMHGTQVFPGCEQVGTVFLNVAQDLNPKPVFYDVYV
jgi:hypothetical protein